MVSVGSWQIETWTGSAGDFHEMLLPPRRSLWVVAPTRPALVLGSSQSDTGIDRDRATVRGVDIVSRHSGGGAVWIDPATTVWIDVVIPSDDDLWVNDVPRSMLWLGHAFARILDPDVQVFEGRYDATELAREYCFGGMAPGEVIRNGAKVVGISQRRTKEAARFQCVAYREYDSGLVADLFTDPVCAQSVRDTEVGLLPASLTDPVAALAAILPA